MAQVLCADVYNNLYNNYLKKSWEILILTKEMILLGNWVGLKKQEESLIQTLIEQNWAIFIVENRHGYFCMLPQRNMQGCSCRNVIYPQILIWMSSIISKCSFSLFITWYIINILRVAWHKLDVQGPFVSYSYFNRVWKEDFAHLYCQDGKGKCSLCETLRAAMREHKGSSAEFKELRG